MHDRPMDFADATLLQLAQRESLATICTIDHSDFETYRINGKRRFHICSRAVIGEICAHDQAGFRNEPYRSKRMLRAAGVSLRRRAADTGGGRRKKAPRGLVEVQSPTAAATDGSSSTQAHACGSECLARHLRL